MGWFAATSLMLALAVLWCAPGYALSRWLMPISGALERAVTSLLFGVVTVAPTTFVAAWLLVQPESLTLMALVSVFWLGAGLAAHRFMPVEPGEPVLETSASRYLVLFAILVSGVMAFSTSYYGLDTTYMWWHCPHLSSMYMLTDGRNAGVVAWDPTWQREVTNLFHHDLAPGYGLKPILKLQRPGNIAYLAQPFLLMSNPGLVAALWCSDFLILGFAMLLAGRHLRSPAGLLFVGVFFLCGARVVSGYQVNENCIGLAVSLGMLHMILRYSDGKAHLWSVVMAGIIGGHFFGIRLAAGLVMPAAAILCWVSFRRVAAFGVALFVGVLPWLTLHAVTWGDPFAHPALQKLEGDLEILVVPEQKVFEGTALETSFYPLNFPFESQLMTGPDHPYPAMFKVPLDLSQAFGVPFWLLAMLGVAALWPKRRYWLGLLGWFLPIPLGLMLIVQLDYQKLSYLLLALAPLPVLAGAGLQAVLSNELRRPIQFAVAFAACALLIGFPLLVRDTELPVDRRKHSSYVNKLDGKIPERRRDPGAHSGFDWNEERLRMTTPRLLPTGVPDMDFLWSNPRTGVNLYPHARLAQLDESLKEQPIESPIMIWAALRPAGMVHQFTSATHKTPHLPPDGVLHSSGSGGGFMYVLKFDAPAPASVKIDFARNQKNTLITSINTSDETVERVGYVSFIVIDPSTQSMGQPELTVDGKPRTLEFVTLWSLPSTVDGPERDKPFNPQPRIISNHPWSIQWRSGSFNVFRGKRKNIRQLDSFHRVCTSESASLYRRCTEDPTRLNSCHYALADRQGDIVAARMPAPGDAVLTTGSAMWRPAQNQNRCWKQLMQSQMLAPAEGEQ